MSLFDRIAQTLDRWLSPAATHPAEDEQGHMALLRESSEHSRAAFEAIREGNLIAASSASVNRDVEALLRYEAQWQDRVAPGRGHSSHASFVEQISAPPSVPDRIR